MTARDTARPDRRFTIKKSTIPGAGRGLFARMAIGRGERLKVEGFRILRGSPADHCTYFADAHKFRVGRQLLIPCGLAGFANHSKTPNTKKVYKGKVLYLETTRPVARGEEIFHRYHRYAVRRFIR